MLGNGFDLYHNLLSDYNDFMTIGEYLSDKYRLIMLDEELENKNIYSELIDLTEKNEAIRKKLLVYKKAYQKTTINKDEYGSFLEELKSNCWFQYFLDIKNRNGWVSLENQVQTTLSEFRKPYPSGVDAFLQAAKEKNIYSETVIKHTRSYFFQNEEFDDFIYNQYNQFVEILKLYLKIFVNNVLPNICNLYIFRNDHFKNAEYILTFNYTDTYACLYDSSISIIHIHGNLGGEIILGINSDEYDNAGINDARFIKYKKYYQRITKHTLSDLQKLIHRLTTNSFEQNGLFIIGHSLDSSDGDIITAIFELFDCITIYFHTDEALDKYVKNLKFIFGSKELSKMTLSQKVIFKKLPQNEFMEYGYDQL